MLPNISLYLRSHKTISMNIHQGRRIRFQKPRFSCTKHLLKNSCIKKHQYYKFCFLKRLHLYIQYLDIYEFSADGPFCLLEKISSLTSTPSRSRSTLSTHFSFSMLLLHYSGTFSNFYKFFFNNLANFKELSYLHAFSFVF